MSAEAIIIAKAIQGVFRTDDYLSFFKDEDIYIFEDEPALEARGIFPYMNIDIGDIKITGADNQDIRDVERHIYPIRLFFSNRNRIKKYIKMGTTGFYGLFDIHDIIRQVIKKDPTFGGVVSNVPWASDFGTQVFQYSEGQFWIGRALMLFSVYKDITIY